MRVSQSTTGLWPRDCRNWAIGRRHSIWGGQDGGDTFSERGIHIHALGVCLFSCLLLFSHWVMSDSLRSHGLQHTMLPWPSLFPRLCSNSCPLQTFTESLLCELHCIFSWNDYKGNPYKVHTSMCVHRSEDWRIEVVLRIIVICLGVLCQGQKGPRMGLEQAEQDSWSQVETGVKATFLFSLFFKG